MTTKPLNVTSPSTIPSPDDNPNPNPNQVTTELLRVTLPVNDTGGGGGGWGDGGVSSSSSEVHSSAERVLQPSSREVALSGAPWQRMVREVRCCILLL